MKSQAIQLDLFLDSRSVMLANEALDALVKRDGPRAVRTVVELRAEAPAQSAAASNGQPTFTIVAPRRNSIVISCVVVTAALSIWIGMNAVLNTQRCRRCNRRVDRLRARHLFLCHHPTAQQVRVEAIIQGHRGYRYAGLATGRHHLRLELHAMLAPASSSAIATVRSVHVSTKNSSGHDIPWPSYV
jgi:hypothetical protein